DREGADDADLGERVNGLGTRAELGECGAVGSYGGGRGQFGRRLVRFDRHSVWGVLLPVRPMIVPRAPMDAARATRGIRGSAGRTRGAGAVGTRMRTHRTRRPLYLGTQLGGPDQL